MLARPPHDNLSHSVPCTECHHTCAEVAKKQCRDKVEVESRVSTDSDLDLSDDDYDGDVDGDFHYRDVFSADLLAHRLKQVQQDQLSREAREEGRTPLQELALAEESYREKMKRISQWRQSTHQSETSSAHSPPEPELEPPPAPTSRKRRFSDTSLPSSAKRPRVSTPPITSPGSPLFPFARSYSLDLPSEGESLLCPYPRAYARSVPLDDALHVCTACDAAFASRQRLRRHGRIAWTDACRAAVTYVLEPQLRHGITSRTT